MTERFEQVTIKTGDKLDPGTAFAAACMISAEGVEAVRTKLAELEGNTVKIETQEK